MTLLEAASEEIHLMPLLPIINRAEPLRFYSCISN